MSDVYESKQFKKAKKLMGEKEAIEFSKRNSEELKSLIATNAVHIQECNQKMSENAEYVKALGIVSGFKAALREKTQSCKVANDLAAAVLSSRKLAQ